MGKKWSMVLEENPVLAARIAAHEKRRAALAAQPEAEPSASEGADKGEVIAEPEKQSHAGSRSGLEVRPGRGGLPAKFNPKRTRAKMGALDEAADHARKIKDREALDAAIDMIIDEARWFVAWWGSKVTTARSETLKKGPVLALPQERGRSAAATKATGISETRVQGGKQDLRTSRHLGIGYAIRLAKYFGMARSLRPNGSGDMQRSMPHRYLHRRSGSGISARCSATWPTIRSP